MKCLLALAELLLAAVPSSAQDSDLDKRKRQILNKLSNQRISLDFTDTFIDEAIGFIREYSGMNIIVDAEVHEKMGEDQLRFTIKVKNLRLKSALKLLLGLRGLSAIYKEGVLVVVPKERIHRSVVTRVYDVRDLTFKIRDFPGPKVELVAPGGGGGALTGATFALEEEAQSTITEDFITELVQANTGGKSWDENESASVSLTNGLLIVTQSKHAHAEIRRLLNLLRQFK